MTAFERAGFPDQQRLVDACRRVVRLVDDAAPELPDPEAYGTAMVRLRNLVDDLVDEAVAEATDA